MPNKANPDDLLKAPGGNFCVYKDEAQIETDEYNRPVYWECDRVGTQGFGGAAQYDTWLDYVRLSNAALFPDVYTSYRPSVNAYGHFTYGDARVSRDGVVQVRFNSIFDPDGTKKLYEKTDGVASVIWNVW